MAITLDSHFLSVSANFICLTLQFKLVVFPSILLGYGRASTFKDQSIHRATFVDHVVAIFRFLREIPEYSKLFKVLLYFTVSRPMAF